MQKIEFKRALIAATPLVLVIVLVMLYDHSVKKDIRCEGKNCVPIANYIETDLVPIAPSTQEPTLQDAAQGQKTRQLENDKRSEARFSGRITWSFFKLAYMLICLIVFAVACGVIYQSFANSGKRALVLILIVVALSAGFGIYLLYNPNHFMSVFTPLINKTIVNDVSNVADVIIRLNAFGFAVVLSAILATCAILYSPQDNSHPTGLKQLSIKMKYLRLILYVGTIMLVVGVLHIRTVYNWSLAFILRDGEGLKVAEGFFSNLLAAEGGVFTLILAAIYLPTAFILRRRAESLVGLPEQNTERETLLTDNGLTFSFKESIPKVVAVLGPFLVGTIGQLVTLLPTE
jgi:hypothetical protein